jgi:hypothetical protein
MTYIISDYYIIYLIYAKSVFPKQLNIGTVFLPTVGQEDGEIGGEDDDLKHQREC